MYKQSVFQPAEILLPARAPLSGWSVVACDQYTSEPAYWEEVERLVGDQPSTLRLILPELYLEQPGVEARIAAIGQAMQTYLANSELVAHENCCIYVERTQSDGRVRHGLVGQIDLLAYDFSPDSVSPLRATEGTVLSRIPPRLAVRKDAPIELPHIMVLIDDPDGTVIEPLTACADTLPLAYDFDLMQNGGHLTGRFVDTNAFAAVDEALAALADPTLLAKKYPTGGRGTLLFAVGDGNHSLATAKTNYENLRAEMTEEEWLAHPARYALIELVNLHDEALQFEPIHRVLFDVDPAALLQALRERFDCTETDCGGQRIDWCYADQSGTLYIQNPTAYLPVGTLQSFLDSYLAEQGGRIDYIHGDDVTRKLASAPGCIGFLLPPMPKSDLFPTVLQDGALPRKTFSMGHAQDKRFYLEAHKVR